ncbi:MAG: CapA family protein [Proteobacteria bacterium]|nr:CapA family protein [Pseudomonadota bacterium]
MVANPEPLRDTNQKHQSFQLKKNETFEILFAGDTSFGENYQEQRKSKGQENILEKYGYDYPLEKLKSKMLSANFVVVNLETPITDIKVSPYKNQKDYIHWTHIQKTPETLIQHHVNLVSLANNHTFDYGEEGFDQTLQILQKYKIPYIGAGNNIQQAGEPFIGEVEFENTIFRFAIIAAFEDIPTYRNKYHTYAEENKLGLMPLDTQVIASSVKQIKKEDPNTFVILYPHWGKNYGWRDSSQLQISQKLLNAGVDLIIGHGAHMIQEFEQYDGKWVVYSIGNFMFNSPGRYKKLKAPPFSYVASLNVNLSDNRINVTLKLYPVLSDNQLTQYQIRFLNETEFNEYYKIINNAKPQENILNNLNIKKDKFGIYLELPIKTPIKQSPTAHTDLLTTDKIWFQDIDGKLKIDDQKLKQLANILYQAMTCRIMYIDSLEGELDFDMTPRLIFVTLSNDILRAKTYLGWGRGIREAINNVLAQVNEMEKFSNFKSLKVDLVYKVNPYECKNLDEKIKFDRSIYGLAFEEQIHLACLPEQIVAYSLINSDQHLNLAILDKYFILSEEQKNILKANKKLKLYFFQVQSYYQSESFQGFLYRGHRLFNDINVKFLLTAATLAGNYLVSSVKDNGDFVYEYLPKMDETSNRYNVLRHAGTIYAMLELYEVTHNEALLKSASLALSNLLNRAKPIVINNEKYLCILENNYAKLGANALAVLAISKFISITKDISYLESGRKLALWIGTAQNSKGEFYIHKMKFSNKANTDFVSNYYPGEAIFALVRFYQIDPNPLWLDIAQKAADYLITGRDKDKNISELEHDHWLLYGLNALSEFRPSPIYISHTLKITKAIIKAQNRDAEPCDYMGSFYTNPRSTPVAIRAEGLCAAYQLLKKNNYDSEVNDILKAIKLCVRFQLQTQFFPEKALYLPNPRRTLGGFSKSLIDYSIRIDYVQHNISSLLGLYHILKQDVVQKSVSRSGLWDPQVLARIVDGVWKTPFPETQAITGIDFFTLRILPGQIFIVTDSKDDWGGSASDSSEFLKKLDNSKIGGVILRKDQLNLVNKTMPALVVENTRVALDKLSLAARNRISGKVICVAGSVGKSTVKQVLGHVLSDQGKTYISPLNYNTMAQVELCLAKTPEDVAYAVYECGVDSPKRTLPKAKRLHPNIVIINDIQPDHLDHYKTLERLVDQKALFFEGLEENGHIILNKNMLLFDRMLNNAKKHKSAQIVTFGQSDDADIKVISYCLYADHSEVEATIFGKKIKYVMPYPGRHMVMNSLSVLSVVYVLGIDINQAINSFGSLSKEKNRTQREIIKLKGDKSFELIDDTFNSNPASVKSAIEYLKILQPVRNGRRIIVLFDQKDLGMQSAAIHTELAKPLLQYEIDKVFMCGNDIKNLADALPKQMIGIYTNDIDQLITTLVNEIRADDIVLFKCSIRLRAESIKVLSALRQMNT